VAADTERPDEGLRNLLSMAELILRVKRVRNFKKDRLREIFKNADEDTLRMDLSEAERDDAWDGIQDTLSVSEMTVERYAGGKPAGTQGILELVAKGTPFSKLLKPGLHFIPHRAAERG
jgi:hypothetical protein